MEHSGHGFPNGAHSHNANGFASYLQSGALVTLEYTAIALSHADIDNLSRNCKDMSNYQLSHGSGINTRRVTNDNALLLDSY
jgi:hypothetical protein